MGNGSSVTTLKLCSNSVILVNIAEKGRNSHEESEERRIFSNEKALRYISVSGDRDKHYDTGRASQETGMRKISSKEVSRKKRNRTGR